MATMTIVVCDVCGDGDRATRRYRITKDTGRTSRDAGAAGAKDAQAGAQDAQADASDPHGPDRSFFDLCAEHARPVEAVLATKIDPASPKELAAASGGSAATVDELARKKQQRAARGGGRPVRPGGPPTR